MRSLSVLFLAFLAMGAEAGAQTPDAPQPVPAFEETIDVQPSISRRWSPTLAAGGSPG